MNPSTHESPSNAPFVRVLAPARLHLGFLDLNGGLGRRFGGIGLALDAPSTVVTAQLAGQLQVRAPASEEARVLRAARAACEALGLDGNASIHVQSHIPPHAGLGSGTQLSLAVAAALARLQCSDTAARALALATQRGQRSGIGIAAFDAGGFVLDGGRGPDLAPPPLLLRRDFPEEWAVLLVFDDRDSGLAGEAEISAFRELPSMRETCAGALCRRVMMQVLPGLVERDFATFCTGIEAVQALVGDYFARVQSGRYASPRVAAAIEHAVALGARGQGQSSWGPTGFAFLPGRDEALRIRDRLAEGFSAEQGLRFVVAAGRNHGASIDLLTQTETPDTNRPLLLQDA
jgi:beta-ribofuranosylaminobenzene 5'-phosphate synthase